MPRNAVVINASDFYECSAPSGQMPTVRIKDMPFKRYLTAIYTDSQNAVLHRHLAYVMKFADQLLSGDRSEIVSGGQDTKLALIDAVQEITCDSYLAENDREFFKLAALFHDIGKYIEIDNHPQIGLYLIRDFSGTDAGRLESIIGREYFASLCSVVFHHDKFGVVQTGEASLPIFADVPYYSSNLSTIKGVLKNFVFVCLCNLIDIAGSVTPGSDGPNQLKKETIDRILDDWRVLVQSLKTAEGERERLKAGLITYAAKTDQAIQRIKRLLISSTEHYPDIQEGFDTAYLEPKIASALSCSMTEFAGGMARIAKLDYGLRFFRALVTGICEEQLSQSGNTIMSSDPRKIEILNEMLHGNRTNIEKIRDIVTIKILKILERFVLRNRSLLWNGNGHLNTLRIGYQMGGVLGKDVNNDTLPQIIIKSLINIDSEPAALSWIADRCPIWFFD